MKIWVFGGSGMLGSEVVRVAENRGTFNGDEHAHTHDVYAPSSQDCCFYTPQKLPDFYVEAKMRKGVAPFVPDVVINCAGLLPGRDGASLAMVNTVAPHTIQDFMCRAGVRLVHMSTDCVFSGAQGKRTMAGKFYSSAENPDPIDMYGRTKLAGEVDAPNVLNVRGSFVGLKHGFLRWVLDYAEPSINAWQKAYWNGTSVKRMAEHLVDLAEGDRTGIVHVAAPEPVSKAWMIAHILRGMEKSTNVILQDEPYINRALWPDIETVPVEQALDELLEEVRSEA